MSGALQTRAPAEDRRSPADPALELLREMVAPQRQILAAIERRPAANAIHVSLVLALAAAGPVNARQLGKFFRTIEAQTIAGVRLDRIGTENQGVIWRVSRVSHSQTHADPSARADEGA